VGRITQLQVYMLFSQLLFSTMIGFFISPLVDQARFMVWLSLIGGAAIGLVVAYVSIRLNARRPERTLPQYGAEILGGWLHYPLMAVIIFINLFSAAYILRQLSDFLVANYLPGTPIWAVAGLFGICIARGVRSGPVTFFRGAQGLFLLSVSAILCFPLFISSEINTDMAIAFITDFHFKGTWNAAVISGALFAQMSFIVYFFPYIAKPEKMMKSLTWAAITAVVVTLADLIPTLMLFGPELTVNLTYPTLEVIRYIRSGTFLENLDPLLIVFWLYTLFLKIGIFLLSSVFGVAHSFRITNHKPFSYTMAAAMVVMSICMFPSAAHAEKITKHSETGFLLFTGCIPVLYFAVDRIRAYISKNRVRAPAD
jgi:spore germination protein KB